MQLLAHEHEAKALGLLEATLDATTEDAQVLIGKAQVHAILALAAATVDASHRVTG